MLNLEEFLRQLTIINPDIQGVALINLHGLPICSVLSRGIDNEIISAMSAAILSVSERAVQELALGGLKRVLVEGVKGIIILSKIGTKAILCTLAKSDASLGMVFLNILNLSNKLKNKDFEGDTGSVPFPYVFKPPTPPGDLKIVGLPQKKESKTENLLKNEPYCKHCGSILPQGQKICHVCGNEVD